MRNRPSRLGLLTATVLVALLFFGPRSFATGPTGPPPGGARELQPGQLPRQCTEADGAINAYGSNYGYYWSETSNRWISAPFCYPRWGFLQASPSQIIAPGATVTVSAIPDDGRLTGAIAVQGGMTWGHPGTVVSGCTTKDMDCTVKIGEAGVRPTEWQWYEFHVSGPGRVFILPPSYAPRCQPELPCLDTNTNAWSFVGIDPDPADPPPTVNITSKTTLTGRAKPGETITYTIDVSAGSATTTLLIHAAAPKGTSLVRGSYGAGVKKGDRVEWRFDGQSSATVTFDAIVQDAGKLPRDLRELTANADAAATSPTGLTSASASDVLELVTVSLAIADGSPESLGGLLIPNPANAKQLPLFEWSAARKIEGIAADGVALLALRATTGLKKHGSFRFRVEQVEFAAEPGSLWAVDDESILGGDRDTMPAGPVVIDVASIRDPRDKKQKLGFALYRAPRNFDAGDSTASKQARSITIKVELLDEGDTEVMASEEIDLDVVRPLVILQHGTFDSIDGWRVNPLHTSTGNELKGYQGFTSSFPFQTNRGDFYSYRGAAGSLVLTAPVAWRALTAAMDDWRQVTGYAGAQVDVICHSYGGVVMRWIAQSQADPATLLSLDTTRNFRNAANWGHGSFHKLITIATTHRGAGVSNHLAFLNRNGALKGAIRKASAKQGSWIDCGAVEDQMVVSPILRELKRTPVPGHVIAGSGLWQFNLDYAERLYLLWTFDAPRGPFKSLGGDPLFEPETFQKMSNFGFNLGQTLQDDTTQNPNYDLTLSSYSSKAGMPLSAQTTLATLESQPGSGSLLGRLTHGDEIAAGGGFRQPMEAVSTRVALLLREPTTSSKFAPFPATNELALTPTEQAFSDTNRFNPLWLYDGSKGCEAEPKPPSSRATTRARAADGPTLTVDPPATLVVAGQQLQVTLISPTVEIASALLVWPAATPGGGGLIALGAGSSTRTIIVPDRRPGPFSIVALVTTAAGLSADVSLDLEIVDPAPYVELRMDPAELVLRGPEPAAFIVRGRLAAGEWRTLNDSSRLTLTSSDPSIVAITVERMLQPGGPGTATVTATFDGGLTATLEANVTGERVPVVAVPMKKGKLKGAQKKPTDFVFLSSPSLDPARIDPASVRIDGVTPVRLLRKKDYNKDGIKDLAAFVSPLTLGLAKGPAAIPMFGILDSGLRIGGAAAVVVQ